MRDSSLSACVQAIMAAEVGHLELAFDYFGEAALMDLDDLEHNTRDGLHMASLAGSWLVAVAGFGGFRDHEGQFSFDPRLPPHLERLAFGLMLRGRRLRVEIVPGEARYELVDGEPIELRHDDTPFTLERGQPAGASRGARRSAGEPPRAAPASRAHPAPSARLRLTPGAVLRWIDRGLPPPQARRKTAPWTPPARGLLVRPRP